MTGQRIALGAAAAALLLSGCGGKKDAARTQLPETITVSTLQQRTISGALTASGRLLPREEAGVSADVSGFRVAQVMVEEGARVRAGQVLAQLDDSLLVSQINQLRAALAQQQVAAEQARDQAARVTGLDNQGVLSAEAIASRRFSARSAAASVAATTAQLNDVLVRRNHLTVRAPFDGIVLERAVRPGDLSGSGSTMFRIARGGLIELYAELPEADLARVTIGDPAEVTLASGRTIAGRVRLVGERVDTQTGLAIARIALPPDPELRQGGFAKARFLRSVSVPTVPEAAVRYDADGASVMVVTADSRIHRVKVRTGLHSGGYVELREGPPPGSRVAVKGAAFTLEGDKVAIAGEHTR